jgi:hypothetical protein
MLDQWQCAQHRMWTVRRRIYAAHLTVCRGIIEQLEQVEIDAFPTAFVTCSKRKRFMSGRKRVVSDLKSLHNGLHRQRQALRILDSCCCCHCRLLFPLSSYLRRSCPNLHHLAATSASLDLATSELFRSFESIRAWYRPSSPHNIGPGRLP